MHRHPDSYNLYDNFVQYHDSDNWPPREPVGIYFDSLPVNDFLKEWLMRKQELKAKEITPEEYFEWKLNWPDTCDNCGMRTPLKKCSLTADDGASPPLEWCTASAEMVHGGRRHGAPDRHAGGLLRDALALAHGLALDLDGIGVVDDPVTDGVGQGGVVQILVPFAGVILGAENSGGHPVPCLYQFQYIPGLFLFQGVEQPLVQNEQLFFLELFHVVPVGSVSPGHRDLHQQIRQADIPDRIKAAAGSHAKGAGQISLSGPVAPRMMTLCASWR